MEQARKICIDIESIAPDYGYHVALTGGTLYKEGPRKDIDLILYEIRQRTGDREGLLHAMSMLGFKIKNTQGWLTKCRLGNLDIDLLFPDYKPTLWENMSQMFGPSNNSY